MTDDPINTTTTIDSFVEYVTAHGEVEVSFVAKTFGVSIDVVEEWVNVLEKANIIKITYKMGKMFVALQTKKPA